jgi:DsbC/DsbD-like thiol-disulfide interchange protein
MRQTIARPVVVAALVGLAVCAGRGDVAGQGAAGKKSDAHVKVTATADKPAADGTQVITVNLAIDKGWHAYANPAGNDAAIPTKVTVEGKKADEVKVDYPPPGKSVPDPDGNLLIWEDSAAIKVTVRRSSDDSPLKLKVKFQTCSDKTCLQPATVELSVP